MEPKKHHHHDKLFQSLELPCGAILKNRIVKSAMSDSLGDGCGDPTDAQMRLYERWAEGGLALSIVGEVQGNPDFAEKPGNLVLHPGSDLVRFETLARRGSVNGTQFWLQLGHAGAMAHPPISNPKGPSAIEMPELTCAALTREEISNLPSEFARTARMAKTLGFGGVQIHSAHGFLLSQFLSPLFNKRNDEYGGDIASRMRLLLEVVDGVRHEVGQYFPVAVKLNATDQLKGGLEMDDALDVVSALDGTTVDLIEISGGTYLPGVEPSVDSTGGGPYFVEFAKHARQRTKKPLMLTGGFKTLQQVIDVLADRTVDLVGLGKALVLNPCLPKKWQAGREAEPAFPKFDSTPEGGMTAWYTMRLTQLSKYSETTDTLLDPQVALKAYMDRDRGRVTKWNKRFHV